MNNQKNNSTTRFIVATSTTTVCTMDRYRIKHPGRLRAAKFGIFSVLLIQLMASAHAQPRKLEEVVVSAQKVEQSVQDVAISMSVLGKEELSKLNIFDFTETAALTPGVEVSPGVISAAIRLRGVGPGSFSLTSPQSVAVFVDEFPQISVATVFSTLVDVERIELLRGPQGTLYGLNAPGGAYNITTRAPDTTRVTGYVESSYSQYDLHGLETYDVRGAINVPLIQDTLALRLSGVYADSEGYAKVVNPLSGEDTTGGKHHEMARARLLWLMSPDMDLSVNVAKNALRDNPLEPHNPAGVVPGTADPGIINDLEDNFYYGDFVSRATTDLLDIGAHWRWNASITDIDFLASYQDFDTHLVDNQAPFPGEISRFDIELGSEQVSTELRFSGDGERVDYVAGLYYSKREVTSGDFDLEFAQDRLVGPAQGSSTSRAAFANLTYSLSDRWDVTAGARYDENDVETFSDFSFAGLQSVVDDELAFEHLSWSFKLRHYLSENQTAYLAIDNAYKQGGFNNLTPGLITVVPIFGGVDGLDEAVDEMLIFDEEISTSFELGIKGTAFEDKMSYTLAVFYQVFDDHQTTQATAETLDTALGDLNSLFLNQLVNVDEVTSQGFEAELNYLLGKYWDIGTRVAYFDPQIEDWQLRFCPAGEEQSPSQLLCPADGGKPLNEAANWNALFQLGYGRPISPDWFFYSNLNWSWNSQETTSDTRLTYDPYNRIGITLGLSSPESGVNIRVWAKDVTQEGDFNPGLQNNLDPALEDNAYEADYRAGREFGLTVTYDFGQTE
jgi:iron complex outermembrane receptor protein